MKKKLKNWLFAFQMLSYFLSFLVCVQFWKGRKVLDLVTILIVKKEKKMEEEERLEEEKKKERKKKLVKKKEW